MPYWICTVCMSHMISKYYNLSCIPPNELNFMSRFINIQNTTTFILCIFPFEVFFIFKISCKQNPSFRSFFLVFIFWTVYFSQLQTAITSSFKSKLSVLCVYGKLIKLSTSLIRVTFLMGSHFQAHLLLFLASIR